MSHEKSITIQDAKGNWVNVPSVQGGKTLSEREVRQQMEAGKIKPLPTNGRTHFQSVDEAVDAAKERSKSFDHRNELLDRATEGSPPFTVSEINRGYRKL